MDILRYSIPNAQNIHQRVQAIKQLVLSAVLHNVWNRIEHSDPVEYHTMMVLVQPLESFGVEDTCVETWCAERMRIRTKPTNESSQGRVSTWNTVWLTKDCVQRDLAADGSGGDWVGPERLQPQRVIQSISSDSKVKQKVEFPWTPGRLLAPLLFS
jgi:hypothetical protein